MGKGCQPPVSAWCPMDLCLCLRIYHALSFCYLLGHYYHHGSGKLEKARWSMLCPVRNQVELSAFPGPSSSPFDLERPRHVSSAGSTIESLELRGLFISYVWVVTPGVTWCTLCLPQYPFSHIVSSALVWPALSPLPDLLSTLYHLPCVNSAHASSLALEIFLSPLT